MAKENRFKKYYGFVKGRDSLLSIPCEHFPQTRIGSQGCLTCRFFVEKETKQYHGQYVICSKKPEFLEALELMCAIVKLEIDNGEYTSVYKQAQKVITTAYGEQS